MLETGISRPLWVKITGCGFAVVLFSCLSIGGIAVNCQYAALEERLQTGLDNGMSAVEADLEAQKRVATGMAAAVAGEPELGELIIGNKRDELIDRFKSSFATIKSDAGLQLITFMSAAQTAIARVHLPDKFGDDVSGRRRMIGEAIRSGRLTTGIEPGLSSLGIFASAPVMEAGRIAGVVDIGTSLADSYFERLKASLHAELAVMLLHGTSFEKQNSTFSGAPPLSQADLKAIFDGNAVRRLVDADGRSLAVGGFVLRDFSGAKIGVLEVASDVTGIVGAGRRVIWFMVVATAAIGILTLIVFFAFARRLSAAIGRLTLAMGRLAGGDLDADVSTIRRADEIGAMSKAVQVFKQAAIDKVAIESEAEVSRKQAETERLRNDEAKAVAARQLAEVVDGIGRGLDQLARGALTFRLDQPFAAGYEQLRVDFNDAMAKLAETLVVVASTTSAIRSGTGEISTASDDLSRRTEQQAASLEESAAALGEVTATVRKTSRSATHARDLVDATKTDAEKSGTVVRRTVEAMNDIERSSREISQIIGVIDEIAFQTNLLALNAGVEAARAGEAGRGFAVVASEVRALAQRSADAAKEIKALISTSGAQVEQGVRLVDETGKVLERILGQVAEINTIVTEIAASAQEQASGLEHISVAITQMDQMTQQNAAMVEESTAASHALSQETEELSKLVGRFHLGSHGGAPASVRPAPPAPSDAAPSRAASMMKSFDRRGHAVRRLSPTIAAANDEWQAF